MLIKSSGNLNNTSKPNIVHTLVRYALGTELILLASRHMYATHMFSLCACVWVWWLECFYVFVHLSSTGLHSGSVFAVFDAVINKRIVDAVFV